MLNWSGKCTSDFGKSIPKSTRFQNTRETNKMWNVFVSSGLHSVYKNICITAICLIVSAISSILLFLLRYQTIKICHRLNSICDLAGTAKDAKRLALARPKKVVVKKLYRYFHEREQLER